MIRRPPRSTRTDPLSPYTTLFRSLGVQLGERAIRGFLIEFRGVQHRLGRDAADIEAGAAQRLPAFGAGGLEAKLRGADRRDIAARTGADHQNVIIEVCHFSLHCRAPAKAGARSEERSVGNACVSKCRSRWAP